MTTNLTKCPDCGQLISQSAAVCRNCGKPQAKRRGLLWWIAAIVGAWLVWTFVRGCTAPMIEQAGTEQMPATATAHDIPARSVRIDSFSCGQVRAYHRGEVVITNTSGAEIRYPKVYVRVDERTFDVPFSPGVIPAGAMATASWMEEMQGSDRCQIVSMQDGSGNRIGQQ